MHLRKTFRLSGFLILCLVFLAGCKDVNINLKPYVPTFYTLTLVDGKVVCPDCDYVVCIEKDSDEDFVILNFADVQMGNLDRNFNFLEQTVDALCDSADPDLITLTGDQSYGLRNPLKRVCAIMEKQGVPWAPVFGNHDCNQLRISLSQQAEIYRGCADCLFCEGPDNLAAVNGDTIAIGNYVVNIVEIDGDSFKVVKSLIFFNSGESSSERPADYATRLHYNNGDHYQALSENQMAWFCDMVDSVQPYGAGGTVSCGVILHIPVFGYVKAADAAYNIGESIYDVSHWMNEAKKISYPESCNPDVWNEGYKDSFGVVHEEISCPPYDDGFFEVMLDTGAADFVLAGHDHVNNFCINYRGIRLVYAMKTGKGSYNDTSMMGGTVLRIKSDGTCTIEHILYTD